MKDLIVGKFAIVTGSSRGIGLSTVEQLLEAGMKVAGWSRSECPIAHEDFLHVPCDISDWKQVEKAYHICRERFGVPFALINNAGIGHNYLLEETPIDVWHRMFNINVHGLFYCSKVVLKDMKKQEEGHIVNISSIAGNNGIEGMTAYCGTKHAVSGISHALFKEVRNKGIKVTCIYPGSVQTNFFDEIESISVNENMMKPSDIASTIVHVLQSDPNYHHVDIEVRPLRPLGKKKN